VDYDISQQGNEESLIRVCICGLWYLTSGKTDIPYKSVKTSL